MLKSTVVENKPETIEDIWRCFEKVYAQISIDRPKSLTDLGIQAELYLGSEDSPASFYFALHYRVEFEEDGEEYSFYELVYCDFDISNIPQLKGFNEDSIDVCEIDYSVKQALNEIYNWWAFDKLKEHTLALNIWSTEV
jgi:hypothetical protein